MRVSYWLLAVGCWIVPARAHALPDTTTVEVADTAAARPEPGRHPGRWWVGAWGAGAQHSKFYTRLGVRHRDFYMAGIRVGRELPVSRHIVVDYFLDFVPLLISTDNPVAFRTIKVCTGFSCGYELKMETATTRGYGVVPIGVQVRMFTRHRVQPVFGLSLGAAWYEKPVPDPDEQQLNFMGDLAAGLQVRVGKSSAMVVGLRQHHTSNAETGRVNPGIDSRVLYFGVTRALSRGQRP